MDIMFNIKYHKYRSHIELEKGCAWMEAVIKSI